MADELYLIRKGAFYYRANCQGYTAFKDHAGRYTLEEAIRESHPNGSDGPRDGMSYEVAPPVCAALSPTPAADEVEAVAKAIATVVAEKGTFGIDRYNRIAKWVSLHWSSYRDHAIAALQAPPRIDAEAVAEILRSELSDTYDCTRVWEAWSVGTMGEDDFTCAADRADEIATAIIAALSGAEPAKEGQA